MRNASVNSSCTQLPHLPSPPPARLLWDICEFCTAWGPGICQPRGHSRAFDMVSYQNITTQKVLLGKTQIGSSVKDRNKLKRVVKPFSRFYACISSLLHYIAKTGAVNVNQSFLVTEWNFCRYYLKNIRSFYKTIYNI